MNRFRFDNDCCQAKELVLPEDTFDVSEVTGHGEFWESPIMGTAVSARGKKMLRAGSAACDKGSGDGSVTLEI